MSGEKRKSRKREETAEFGPARYASVKQFLRLFFVAGSEPCDRTVRRWAGNGLIPAITIGSRIYIDMVAFRRSGESLFDKIVRDVSRSS